MRRSTNVVQQRRRESATALVLLVLYLVLLLWLTLRPGYRMPAESINLVPLRSIMHGITRGGPLFVINILGNIAAFMPLGTLLWRWRRVPIVPMLCAAALLSLTIELLQWSIARRVSDIDDLLLNVLGAALGYLLAWRLAGRDR